MKYFQPELPLEWADDCVETHLRRDKNGYGKKNYRLPGRKHKTAPHHRWVYAQQRGPIPEGLQVLHSCDNPPCININHLRLGTHQDNMDDRARRGRWVGWCFVCQTSHRNGEHTVSPTE